MIKVIYKKFLIIIMLMLIALSFCACAQVRVMTVTNNDDTIDEFVSITINQEEIINAGYSALELKSDIETNSYLTAKEMVDRLNNKIASDLLMVTDEESIQVLNSFVDGMEVVTSNWKDNTYIIGIRFKNINVYKYYYNIKEQTNIEMKEEKHFFYNKMYYYASTMYVKHNDLYSSLNAYYSLKYSGLIDSENNELLYTYVTDLRRQHSDADYITKQNGKYYHTWVVDKNKLDEPIMLYYNVANPENYIIVSLLATLGVTVVLLIVGMIIKVYKKNKKSDEV